MSGLIHLLLECQSGISFWYFFRVEQSPHDDPAAEQYRQHQTGQHASHEQLGDRKLCRYAVHNQDDGWWNQQAQCCRATERADDLRFGVAAFLQFWNVHLAHCGARCGGGAGYRGKDGAANDVGVQQPTGQRIDPGRQAAKHVFGQVGAVENFSHPHKQRQGSQRPAAGRAPDGHGHRITGSTCREKLHAKPSHSGQSQADPHSTTQ